MLLFFVRLQYLTHHVPSARYDFDYVMRLEADSDDDEASESESEESEEDEAIRALKAKMAAKKK